MSGPTAKIELVGNRIHAAIPYAGGRGPTLAKSVAGARWAKTSKRWTYPLDMEVCRQFRDVFEAGLEIGPDLWSWATSEKAREGKLVELASLTDAALAGVAEFAPLLFAAMSSRTYQRVGSAFIAAGKSVLVADQPGLGKTLEAMGGIIEAGAVGPSLVFAPVTVMEDVWGKEIPRWLGGLATVTCAVGQKASRLAAIADFRAKVAAEPTRYHFLVVNIEMARTNVMHSCLGAGGCDGKSKDCPYAHTHEKIVRHHYPELFEAPWSAILLDESHRALVRRSGSPTLVRTGMTLLPLAEDGLKVALSGTPMRGKPQHLWGTLNWLRPDVYTSFWNWCNAYFTVIDNGYGSEIGELRADRLEAFERSLRPIVLRRTKEEVAADLPPKMYAGSPLDPAKPTEAYGVWLPMEPDQAKIYRQMVESATANLDGGDLMATGILAEMTRLKQFASSAGYMSTDGFRPSLPSNKFNYLIEMLSERGITGDEADEGSSKIVVVSQFTSLINVFAEELGKKNIPTYVLTGETKAADRSKMVEKFQSDSTAVRVFLLNVKAGGVGITLDAADDIVFLDETWIPDDQEQAEDRIHRVSRVHPVTVYYLRSLGTIEEFIARVTEGRETVVRSILDGSRGVDFARRLLEGKA